MKTKLFFKKLLGFAMMVLIIVSGVIYNAEGAAAAKTKKKTFKNTSAVAANDFHLVTFNGKGVKNANCPGFGAQSDKAFNPPEQTVDWASGDNVTPIPADGSIEITMEGAPLTEFSDDSYFTLNGVEVGTKMVACAANFDNTGALTGAITFSNYGNEAIVLSSVIVHVDNNNNPISSGPAYSPTGSVVPGIPATINLGPGASQSFPYTFANAALFVSTQYNSALASDPGDLFDEQSSAIQSVSIPTLTQWGLIILAGLLLIVGVFFLRQRFV